jgi:hypothetical protein
MHWTQSILPVVATLLLTGCPPDKQPDKPLHKQSAAGDDQPVIISGGSVLIFGQDLAGFQDASGGGPPWVYKYSIPPATPTATTPRVSQVSLKIPGDAANFADFTTLASFKITLLHGKGARNVVFSSDANQFNLTIVPTLDSGDSDKWQKPLAHLLRFRGLPIKSIAMENVTPVGTQTICINNPRGSNNYVCPVNIKDEQPVIRICVADPHKPCS